MPLSLHIRTISLLLYTDWSIPSCIIFSDDFSNKELKARMRHTTEVLHAFMFSDFRKAVHVLGKLIEQLQASGTQAEGLAYIFLPDYIEVYGIDDLKTSVSAMEKITQ